MVKISHELAYYKAKARHDYMRTREVIFGHLDLQSNELLVSFFVHCPASALHCPPWK